MVIIAAANNKNAIHLTTVDIFRPFRRELACLPTRTIGW